MYWLKIISFRVRQAHFHSCVTWGKLLILLNLPLSYLKKIKTKWNKADNDITLSHKITVNIKWENACKMFYAEPRTQKNCVLIFSNQQMLTILLLLLCITKMRTCSTKKFRSKSKNSISIGKTDRCVFGLWTRIKINIYTQNKCFCFFSKRSIIQTYLLFVLFF